MIDKKIMRSQLDSVEQNAEAILRENPSFAEALEALKKEIDQDAGVRAATRQLVAAGRRVSNCFAPRVRIGIKGRNEVQELSGNAVDPAFSQDPIAGLIVKLTEAAGLVVQNSRHCERLEDLVQEAVTGSDHFDEIASEIESAGQQLVIGLDLAVFAQDSAPRNPAPKKPVRSEKVLVAGSTKVQLSAADLKFLQALKITVD